jgi:outer membrane protein assembly factor BamB
VIHAIDRRTGQATWKYNALQDGGKQAEFHGIPVVTADLVVFGSDDRNPGGVGYVYAFEQKTGKVQWKYRAGAGVMADLVHDGNRLYGVTLEDELICLDLSTGRQNWRFSRGWVNEKMTNVMAAPVVIGERLLFGGQDGVVRALDARSGQLISKREVGAPVTTPLVAVAGAVYFGTVNHRIHRLALNAGEAHAELDLGGTPFGPPTLLGDSLVVLVYDNPDTATLKSVDLAVNGLRWSRETSGGWSSARAYLWRSWALAGSQRGKLAAFSPDGSEDWSDTIGGVIRGIGVGDDVLYVGTLRGTLYAYRPDRRLEGP